jgi:predicted acyltransferase
MARLILFALGLGVLGLAATYFWTGKPGYLRWAKGLFLVGLGAGVSFFVVLLILRLS